ncbi:MAG: 3-deoxy-manno-octulosonate cytidylyltransferase [Bacteroidota bacterium]
MKVIGIIPSRYASGRFPGKPLIDIEGKTMIRRVYEQAMKATSLSEVIVATDDERIFNEVKNFGGKVVMTSPAHKNGTERCAEVAQTLDTNVIINIQGDEPFIQPEQIDLIAKCFSAAAVQIATLIKQYPLNEELQNAARVKVVIDKNMEALYFSRSMIPFIKGDSILHIHGFQHTESPDEDIPANNKKPVFYKHIGLYGYRKDVLVDIVKLLPSPLELTESLEQLRWLEYGYRIKCALTDHESLSIDTPADLAALRT